MDEAFQAFVGTLSRLTQEVAHGRYENVEDLFRLTAAGDNPAVLTDLAEAFGMMIVQVEAREFRLTDTIRELREAQRQLELARARLAEENATLKQQVTELRIEIDHSRKESEIAEITDTDYFQSLQRRAKELRRRGG